MWINQISSRRQTVIMEGGRPASSIEVLPPQILGMGVDQLPGHLLDTLGLQLFNEGRGVAGNWEGVAEELGIQTTNELEQIRRHAHRAQVFPGRLMLSDWGKKNGSTVFVLLNALRRQGREDCVESVLKACQDAHSMQLIVKIEEVDGQQRFITVTTKKEASLGSSLENVLSSLANYVITGPSDKLTWNTPAYHLKGQQLSLKKGDITEETERSIYGPLQITQRVPVLHDESVPQTSYTPYSTPSTPVPLNIPVTEALSVSANFVSTTNPKFPHRLSSTPPIGTYNDLSMTARAKKPAQDLHSLVSHTHIVSEGPSPSERQTLLKKPCYSIDESIDTFPTLHSMTATKHRFTLNQCRTGSLEEHSSPLQRCDPLRHSADKPARHPLKVTDYISHTHQIISFSNPDKQSSISSPKCPGPSRVLNEAYVSRESLMSPILTPRCKPPSNDSQPNPMGEQFKKPGSAKPLSNGPVPCVLQQRKDGYIDIIARRQLQNNPLGSAPYNRQKSLPNPAVSMDTSEVQVKERPQSVPDVMSKVTPAQCVVERDSNGYATFASPASLMEVDNEEGSAGSNAFQAAVEIDIDADGYLSYTSGSTSTNPEDMDSDSSGNLQRSTPNRIVIQQSIDGYFGFGVSSSSSSSQVSSASAPAPCEASGYVPMNRSESLPSRLVPERNADGLIYAKFSEEDEEEDADYFDMKQLPNIPRNTHGQVNRHWSEGDMPYLDITPTQYDYINETDQSKSRALPPRPSQPIPMKRMRLRSQEPANQTRGDTWKSCDMESVPGWCPKETEESIPRTMKRYQQEDGNFILWRMDRKDRYVITVSHMGELRHYAVYEQVNGSRSKFFVFRRGKEFDNLKTLVEHYMSVGLKGPDVPEGENRGKRWQQFSHVRLRRPLKVKYTHTVVRKKAT